MKFVTKIEKAWLLIGLIAGLAWAIGRGSFGVEENSQSELSPTAPKIVLSSPLPLRSSAPHVTTRKNGSQDDDTTPAGFGS